MALTHSCNNALADSAGYKDIGDIEERWGGLSPFGHDLIHEMNRVGIFVDLSHVSDKTALQALDVTRSPRGMEDASRKLRQKAGPSMAIYGKRHDLDPKLWSRS